jgi:Mrp family chromosome partitioning ATPase
MDAEKVWRWLAVSLMRSERLKTPWAVGITSAVHGEGKTTSALALAVALARETDQQVLLVETDMEKPIISRLFNRRLARGLPHYLTNGSKLGDVINHVQGTNLNLLTAGDSSISPTDLPLGELSISLRRQFPHLIQNLRKEYSHIVVDLPALLEDPNTHALTESLDGTLMVVKSGVTPIDKAKDAATMLGEAQTLGVVHISAPSAVPRWLNNLVSA